MPTSTDRLEALFDRHADAVYRYARVRLGPTDADDVVSEVFLVAWRRLEDVGDNPEAWLLAVARRVVSNQLRSQGRVRALTDRLETATPACIPDHAGAVEELDLAARALDRLSPADQEVVALLAAGTLTGADLAAVLGCSPRAATVRAHRARKRLDRAYAAEEAGDRPAATSAARGECTPGPGLRAVPAPEAPGAPSGAGLQRRGVPHVSAHPEPRTATVLAWSSPTGRSLRPAEMDPS